MLSPPKNCTVYMQKASFPFGKKPATPTKGHRWSVRFFSNSQLGRGFSIYTPPLWAKLDRTQVHPTSLSSLTHSTLLYHPPARDWRSTAVQKVASHYFPLTGWVVAYSFFIAVVLLFLCLSLSCSSPFIRDLFFALVIVALALPKPNPDHLWRRSRQVL